jgi:hypothetical protein
LSLRGDAGAVQLCDKSCVGDLYEAAHLLRRCVWVRRAEFDRRIFL